MSGERVVRRLAAILAADVVGYSQLMGRALWRGFDDWLVDQTIVEGLGHRVRDVTNRVVKLQSGYLYTYAFVMLIGIALLLTWVITTGGLLG